MVATLDNPADDDRAVGPSKKTKKSPKKVIKSRATVDSAEDDPMDGTSAAVVKVKVPVASSSKSKGKQPAHGSKARPPTLVPSSVARPDFEVLKAIGVSWEEHRGKAVSVSFPHLS